jgi:hypothetical protein
MTRAAVQFDLLRGVTSQHPKNGGFHADLAIL